MKEKKTATIAELMHANKNLLMIVADPKTDEIIVGYRDNIVGNRFIGEDGKNEHIIRDVLKNSRFKDEIDNFLTRLMREMQTFTRNKSTNTFFLFIDGAISQLVKGKKMVEKPIEAK